MKNYFILTALLCWFFSARAQSPLKSINYQALIVDPATIELPGSAVQAQLYLNKDIWVKFGIYAGSTLQFEELHKTKTDAYGLINLEIGAGENTGAAGTFASLNWGGTVKKLVTQVSFDLGAKYTEVSNRGLNYLPYAHFAEEAGKLSGILPLTSGGTGATTSAGARGNLGLGNVDNTADVDKPVSSLTLAQINTKESLLNKSTSILKDSASSDKYPSVKAVKDYLENHLANANVTNQASSANLAAKATALATPRTINGVPFDGTSNISIPFVVTGLTTTNLSSTAGITNSQLASSAFTLGSTLASLGGTYSNVSDLTLASPVLTGIPTAPTADSLDNSQQIATTAFVQKLKPQLSLTIPLAALAGTVAGLLSNSDYTLFTNKQSALTAGSGISITSGSVAASDLTTTNFSATAGITNGQLASSAFTLGSTTATLGGTYTNVSGLTLASPVLTGIPTAPTAATSDNSQQLATTAFVQQITANLGGVTTVSAISVNAAGDTFSSTVTNPTSTPQLSLTIPLASAAGTTAGLLSNSDYTLFTNKQTALTAGTDYQTPISAGSGISITAGTVVASGLTTANLSATASITNTQLANSQITIGSTNASLGGTYSNVTGLSSVGSTSFVGALTGNASTATTLQTARTIFGASFDGSTALAGIISPIYGGTGSNNGANTLTLGGNLSTSGNFATVISTTATTAITLPTSGTLATLSGTETFTNKTLSSPNLSGTTTVNGALTVSGTNVLTAGGTTFPMVTGSTGQVLTLSSAGTATWSTTAAAVREVFDETASNGSLGTLIATTAAQTNFTLSQTPHSLSKLRMFVNGILISQNAYTYQTTSSFNSTTTTPTRYLSYVNTYNGTYAISAGDRIQFLYYY